MFHRSRATANGRNHRDHGPDDSMARLRGGPHCSTREAWANFRPLALLGAARRPCEPTKLLPNTEFLHQDLDAAPRSATPPRRAHGTGYRREWRLDPVLANA